jgi:hypothetical protein
MKLMRTIHLIIILILGFLNTYGQYHAVYIPDEKLSKITMDGDTSDWNWVPAKYFINTANMNDVILNKSINEKNWGCKIIIGWNDVKNWVYIVAIVHDDVRNVDPAPKKNFWFDDCFEIAVNPDLMGGNYADSTKARFLNVIKLHFSAPKTDSKNEFQMDKGPAWFLKKAIYLDWGWKIYKSNSDLPGYIVYEVGMSLWDIWSYKGAEFSKRHVLTPSESIRLVTAFDDVDKTKDHLEAQWTNFAEKHWSSLAQEIPLLILDPPIVNTVTWDGINQLLKP